MAVKRISIRQREIKRQGLTRNLHINLTALGVSACAGIKDTDTALGYLVVVHGDTTGQENGPAMSTRHIR